MPIRDFTCPNCGNEFEKIVKISETVTNCKKCNYPDCPSKISAPAGFQFKGSGFYETDYKHK